jgi:hypothetical protein
MLDFQNDSVYWLAHALSPRIDLNPVRCLRDQIMKYKNLKSVAHNFGHSFTSDMNYAEDDFVMSHLARSAIRTGSTEM